MALAVSTCGCLRARGVERARANRPATSRIVTNLSQKLLLEHFQLVFILDLLLLSELLRVEDLLFTLVYFLLQVADFVKLLPVLQLHALIQTLGQLEVVLAYLERCLAFAERL